MAALSPVLPMGVGNGNVNAFQPSYFPRPRTLSASRSFSGVLSKRLGSGLNLGIVQESAEDLVRKSRAELGPGVYQRISDVNFVNLLEWIQAERLTTLPHKGSRWDRVLIRALYFAERLHDFNVAIQGFALDSNVAVKLGYGHTQLLLELGRDNSEAVDKVLAILYKFGLSLSAVLRRSELLAETSNISEHLCLLFKDLLTLVVDVATRFYKRVNSMVTTFVGIDIYDVFSETMEKFRGRQNTITEAIWNQSRDTSDSDEALDAKTLTSWLSPQDRVISTLNRDHAAYTEYQAEYTCIWFQQHLHKFIKDDHRLFLVTGKQGSGKTILAGAIAERFQRPVSHRSFDSIFCSLNPEIPSQSSSLGLVKSLLFQLMNLRVGNRIMYDHISEAYHACQRTNDLEQYENHLWHALTRSLENPLDDDSNELVIIVDGLDEISENKAHVRDAYNKLKSAVIKGKGARLIVTSNTSSVISATKAGQEFHYDITDADLRDDLHAVAFKILDQNTNFHNKLAKVQENLLDKIIREAQGSFLWTTITCEILNKQTSTENMNKLFDKLISPGAQISDLVLTLFNILELNDKAKTILSWLMVANRPLTVDELHCLFSIDLQTGTSVGKRIDTSNTVDSLKPMLALQEGIVRFKHPSIRLALREFASKGKILGPIKDVETDIVLRILTYSKLTIRDMGEPTLDPDQNLSQRLFKQHALLEYSVRYWTFHLEQSRFAPKSTEVFKSAPDFTKAFPESTILPILEGLSWSAQWLPGQALERFTLAVTVRKSILKENHLAILQTYLSTASTYARLFKFSEETQYYYLATKISKEELGDFHPLTLEVADRFLRGTDRMEITSRTTSAINRESVLELVITAYERLYGDASDLVIDHRLLLVKLLCSLREIDRAKAVWQILDDSTIRAWGKESLQYKHLRGQWEIYFGKGKDQPKPHDPNLPTPLPMAKPPFELSRTSEFLDKAEDEIKRGDIVSAERTYVTLWHDISRSRFIRSIEWHEKYIQVASCYAQFLWSQDRKTESSAVLIFVWKQYEHNHVQLSDTMVTRLIKVAKSLKYHEDYSSALSIFMFARTYYRNQQETSINSEEVTREITSTSALWVKQTLSVYGSISELSGDFSVEILHYVFNSVLNSSESIDTDTMTLAKKLSSYYMEQSNYSTAITIIHDTLARTWGTFLSGSSHDIILATTFVDESVELIEYLATCHFRLNQMDRVADIYTRLFRALLSSDRNFEESKKTLVNFYDERGYFDEAITVYKEVFAKYKTSLSMTDNRTIEVLYTLATRCRAHPRTHPYWVDYYQQIITSLNKRPDVCHPDALDAAIIVAGVHRADRRYAEAVALYNVVWETFVSHARQATKEHQKEREKFSSVDFVHDLYRNYFQSLQETNVHFKTLYKVTEEFRTACITRFKVESSISIEATLVLARMSRQSTEYEHRLRAISLYEEVSTYSKIVKMNMNEIKLTLSWLYRWKLDHDDWRAMTKETTELAIKMIQQNLSQSKEQYGYAHESSLFYLRKLVILRQDKVEDVVRILTTAVQEIMLKETKSRQFIDSAHWIAETFREVKLDDRLVGLVEELHRQICAKDFRYATKWSINVKQADRSALAFLASMQYCVQRDIQKNGSVTLAQVMANLTMEYTLFETFTKCLGMTEGLEGLILAAAPLRTLLVQSGQKDIAAYVESEIVTALLKDDSLKLSDNRKPSLASFVKAILEYTDNETIGEFNHTLLLASNQRVEARIRANDFQEAYDVADIVYHFALGHKLYERPEFIALGFKLAYLLAVQDEHGSETGIRHDMLVLSQNIAEKLMDICKTLKIDLIHIPFPVLNQLAALLARQGAWKILESFLTALWETRDAQRSWSSSVLIKLGRRLIYARYNANLPIKAIRLCEDMAYNMRRAHGPRTAVTIETYELLAELYTSTALDYQKNAAKESTGSLANEYFRKAFRAHEDILQILVFENGTGDDSDDELDAAAELLALHGSRSPSSSVNGHVATRTPPSPHTPLNFAAIARRHLDLMRLAYQRLGDWPRPYSESRYRELSDKIFAKFDGEKEMRGAQPVKSWSNKGFGKGNAESDDGTLKDPLDWSFADEVQVQRHTVIPARKGGKRGYGGLGLGVASLNDAGDIRLTEPMHTSQHGHESSHISWSGSMQVGTSGYDIGRGAALGKMPFSNGRQGFGRGLGLASMQMAVDDDDL